MCLFGTVKACSRFGWLCVCVLMTSEASSDAMAFELTNSDVRGVGSDVRGQGGVVGVVLVTSECGGSDVRGYQ